MLRGLITITALIGLAACQQNPDTLAALREGPSAPEGTVVLRDAVDGVLVGHRLMDAGEYDLALRAFYRGAADQGLTADVLSGIGSANLRLGRLGQAEENLRMAIELDEDFPPAWNNLGVVLMEKGEYGEACAFFSRLLHSIVANRTPFAKTCDFLSKVWKIQAIVRKTTKATLICSAVVGADIPSPQPHETKGMSSKRSQNAPNVPSRYGLWISACARWMSKLRRRGQSFHGRFECH